ncbi:mechanosensitive ion channel family protein [Nonlabens sp.]|uniref:mechanosensitive ion channel family protein n=1 Tax=Nonlabens sp. TaxID=1888209 RepID=UPI003F69BAD1
MKELWENIEGFFTYQIISAKNDGDFHLDVKHIIFGILAVIIASLVLRGIKRLLTRKMDETDKLKFDSIFKFFNYLVYLIVIIVVLNSSGVNLTAILTASAALFVGIGFALQDFFKDIIAGITILVDKSLLVNDIIEMEGKIGRIFEIRLRTTRAITRDDKVLVIPNHLFLTQTIYNYTQNHPKTRESIAVGVAYGSDTELVKQQLLDCANKQSGVLKSPQPFVLFNNFGDSALEFGLYFFVRDSFVDPRIKSELRFAIDKAFREHNITIPFPQRDVHVFQAKEKSL